MSVSGGSFQPQPALSSRHPSGRPRLGVNVDHVATLRQQRGTAYPDPVDAACLAERAGADQITVHLREDRRHIQERDVHRLKQTLARPLNLEMAATDAMVAFALAVRPGRVTLVPERREERTTEGGLSVATQSAQIERTVQVLHDGGIVVSLFIDPDLEQVRASKDVGAVAVELHTGDYCEAKTASERASERLRVVNAALHAHALGLEVAAGHGLDYKNVFQIADIGPIVELNIGHSIVSHALVVGFEQAVRDMLDAMLRP